jgi:hypothetical protein
LQCDDTSYTLAVPVPRVRPIIEQDGDKLWTTTTPLFHNHDGAPRCGIAAHLTPTKRKRKNQKGELQNRNLEGYLVWVQWRQSIRVHYVLDDECHDAGWLFGKSKGRTCFAAHRAEITT